MSTIQGDPKKEETNCFFFVKIQKKGNMRGCLWFKDRTAGLKSRKTYVEKKHLLFF